MFPQGRSAAGWFARNRFALREGYVHENGQAAASRDDLEARFARATRQAQRWMLARLVVTILLGLGVAATAAALLFAYVPALETYAGGALDALRTLAALAASLSAALVVARLVILRALVRYDVATTFLGGRLARGSP